jgi:NOL1/NOP2/fmu family ribosome biogenesis protein
MQNLVFLNSKARKEFLSRLEKLYGFHGGIQGHLMQGANDKVYLLGDSDIIRNSQDKELRIDRAGLKIATLTTGGARLNIEGTQLLGPGCKERVLEIDHSHFEPLVKGEDFLLSEDELRQANEEKGLFILRMGSDFLGSGIVKEGRLLNCFSKNRRVKNLNN